eukprot:m51a1_g7415 hypothetical protein (1881) ;mRNA; f:216288-222343
MSRPPGLLPLLALLATLAHSFPADVWRASTHDRVWVDGRLVDFGGASSPSDGRYARVDVSPGVLVAWTASRNVATDETGRPLVPFGTVVHANGILYDGCLGECTDSVPPDGWYLPSFPDRSSSFARSPDGWCGQNASRPHGNHHRHAPTGYMYNDPGLRLPMFCRLRVSAEAKRVVPGVCAFAWESGFERYGMPLERVGIGAWTTPFQLGNSFRDLEGSRADRMSASSGMFVTLLEGQQRQTMTPDWGRTTAPQQAFGVLWEAAPSLASAIFAGTGEQTGVYYHFSNGKHYVTYVNTPHARSKSAESARNSVQYSLRMPDAYEVVAEGHVRSFALAPDADGWATFGASTTGSAPAHNAWHLLDYHAFTAAAWLSLFDNESDTFRSRLRGQLLDDAASPTCLSARMCINGEWDALQRRCVCLPGYGDLGPSLGCVRCPRGFFKTGPGNRRCSRCPLHSSTLSEGSAAASDCLCDPDFGGDAAGIGCYHCARGNKTAAANAECVCWDPNAAARPSLCRCVDGFEGDPQMEVVCVGCGPHAVRAPNRSCVCRAGYEPSAGDACGPCAAGSFKANDGNHSCGLCPDGMTSGDQGAESCVCAADHTTLVGHTCVCSAGYTRDEYGSCVLCPGHMYKDVPGDSACAPCPANSDRWDPSTDASSVRFCPCFEGFGELRGSCELCTGLWQTPAFSATRQPCACPEALTPAGDCVCGPGRTLVGSECRPCPANTSKPEAGNHNCTPCAANLTTLGREGQASCACQEGYYRFDDDACLACPAGMHRNAAGNPWTCDQCERGWVTLGAGSANCTPGPGFSSSGPCPEGTYKSDAGDTECLRCPYGMYSFEASTSQADCFCPSGSAVRWDPGLGLACQSCPAGQFSIAPTQGGEGCRSCPAESTLNTYLDLRTVNPTFAEVPPLPWASAFEETARPAVGEEIVMPFPVQFVRCLGRRIAVTADGALSACNGTLQMDLLAAASRVHPDYSTLRAGVAGTAPNRTFIVELSLYLEGESRAPARLQALLYERVVPELYWDTPYMGNRLVAYLPFQMHLTVLSNADSLHRQLSYRLGWRRIEGLPLLNVLPALEGPLASGSLPRSFEYKIESVLPCHCDKTDALTHDAACGCPPGMYLQTGSGWSMCAGCPADKYKPGFGNDVAACLSCPAGTKTAMPEGRYASSLRHCVCSGADTTGNAEVGCQACVAPATKPELPLRDAPCSCPAGLVATSTTCDTCAAGYQPVGDECLKCPSGSYKASSGNHSCSQCPSNRGTEGDGSMSQSECKCSPGFGLHAGQCQLCPFPLLKGGLSDDACPCPPEMVLLDSNLCACAAGFGLEGAACQTCGSGVVKPDVGNHSCAACPVTSVVSQGNCTPCAAGRGSPAGENTCSCLPGWNVALPHDPVYKDTCVICPPSTFKPEFGTWLSDEGPEDPRFCHHCPLTTLSGVRGSTRASDCVCTRGAGWLGPDQGCVWCPVGTYKTGIYNGPCLTCPTGATPAQIYYYDTPYKVLAEVVEHSWEPQPMTVLRSVVLPRNERTRSYLPASITHSSLYYFGAADTVPASATATIRPVWAAQLFTAAYPARTAEEVENDAQDRLEVYLQSVRGRENESSAVFTATSLSFGLTSVRGRECMAARWEGHFDSLSAPVALQVAAETYPLEEPPLYVSLSGPTPTDLETRLGVRTLRSVWSVEANAMVWQTLTDTVLAQGELSGWSRGFNVAVRVLPDTPRCLCAEDTFLPEPNATACVPCPAGATRASSDTSNTCLCAENTFLSPADPQHCTACPAGSTRAAGDTTNTCTCSLVANTVLSGGQCVCAAGRFLGPWECDLCPWGTYKDVPGNQPCEPCGPNTGAVVESPLRDRCFCLRNYSGDARTGNCSLCVGGTKPEGNGLCSC